MLDEAFPRLDAALAEARLYLTEKNPSRARLDDFTTELRKLNVPSVRREAVTSEHFERLNNIGRASLAQSAEMKTRVRRYADGHADRSRTFFQAWLKQNLGKSAKADERIADLMRALSRALGG